MIPARGVVCHLGLAPLLNVPSDGKTVPEDMPSSLHWGRLGGRVGWGLRQHGGGVRGQSYWVRVDRGPPRRQTVSKGGPRGQGARGREQREKKSRGVFPMFCNLWQT